MKINQGMNQVSASSTPVSPEVKNWKMASQVPESLVKDLKKELPEKFQKAVFSSMDDLLETIDGGIPTGETTGQKLIDLGFKKLGFHIEGQGEHYTLTSSSGDFQQVSIVDNDGKTQVKLNTSVGKTESQIDYSCTIYANLRKEILNNLYLNGEQTRPTQKAIIVESCPIGDC